MPLVSKESSDTVAVPQVVVPDLRQTIAMARSRLRLYLTVDPRAGALVGGGTGSNMCGLQVDGTAWCWGNNDYGQMGNGTVTIGTFGEDYRAPGVVPGHLFRSIWPGETMCGVRLDGTTLCWGYADRSSLGNGVDTAPGAAQLTPVAVLLPAGVTVASMSAWASAHAVRATRCFAGATTASTAWARGPTCRVFPTCRWRSRTSV